MKRLAWLLLFAWSVAGAQDFVTRVPAAQQTLSDLWSQLQTVQTQLVTAQSQSSADASTIAALKSTIASLSSQVAALQAQLPCQICAPAPVADTQPPTTPTNLVVTSVTPNQVNLAWNPSTDNVGVTAYQVYLNDVLLASTPIPAFQHTGLTPGTTYNYRVSASDAVPNYSPWTAAVTVTTPAAPGPIPVPPAPVVTPDADFMARCVGATLCAGLDSETEIAAGIDTAADGTRQGFPDTTVKTSGAASLKFTLRKGVSVANIGGAYDAAIGSFGAGQTMYVQFRVRLSPEWVTNQSVWDRSFKFINLHGANSTCQATEITTITEPRAGGKLLDMYTNCGNGWVTDPTTNALLASCSGDCLLQQGSSVTNGLNVGYNCHYQNQHPGDGNGDGCFFPTSGVWYTIYEVIKLGARGTPQSSVNAFVAQGGGPYKQFQRVAGVTWGSGGDATFTRARLETYMTQLSSAAPINAFVWYDELIVSTKPIPAPNN